jgi:short-subunit dehydrogenase
MKKAVVSGASSGIGKAITKRLLKLGYGVIGISRNIKDDEFDSDNFEAIRVDLSDEKQTLELSWRLKKENIAILVNNAGIGRFAPHEELSQNDIIKMSFLNLTAPMLLSNALLRSLKKNGGYIFNITSIEATRASRFAGVYSATKAGLKTFGECLFEECRKSDLSITNIQPDMTQTNFYENLRFDVSNNEDEKLFADDIANTIEYILHLRKGAVVSECTIRGLKFGITKKSRANI